MFNNLFSNEKFINRAMESVGHLFPLGSERSREQYRWYLHYMTCIRFYDEKSEFGSSKYCLLEGLDRETALAEGRRYLSSRPMDPIPDLIRKGIRKLGEQQYHTIAGDDKSGFLVEKLPYAIEIGLSYNNVQLTLERKLSSIKDDHPRLFMIFAYNGSDFISFPNTYSIDTDQVNFCLQFLKEQFIKMDQYQAVALQSSEKEDQHYFKSVDGLKRIPILKDDNQEVQCKDPSVGRFIIQYEPLALPKAVKPAVWKGLAIANLVHLKVEPGEKGVKEILDKVDLSGQDILSKYLYSLSIEGEIRKKKCDQTIHSQNSRSILEHQVFGIGIKKNLAKKYDTYNYVRGTRSYNPYFSTLIDFLTSAGQYFPIETNTPVYHEIDEYANKCSKAFCASLGYTQCNGVISLCDNYNNFLVSACNNFNGIDCNLIRYLGDSNGFWLKGPSHPKRDTDKIPFVFAQLILTSSVQLWRRLTEKRSFLQTTIPGATLMVWRTNLQKSTCRHLGGISRIWLHNGAITFEEIFRKIEGNCADDEGILDETLLFQLIRGKDNAELSQSERQIRLATLICCTLCNDVQMEGFLANIRRLLHQTFASYRGKAVYRRQGASPEQKVNDCIINNIGVLHLATTYNEDWIVAVNKRMIENGVSEASRTCNEMIVNNL